MAFTLCLRAGPLQCLGVNNHVRRSVVVPLAAQKVATTSGRKKQQPTQQQQPLSNDQRFPHPPKYIMVPSVVHLSKEVYTAGELAVVLFMLGVADAGYSGDWSRIGVLTTAQEQLIQQVFGFMCLAHVACSGAAIKMAVESGFDAIEAGVKALFAGTLGLYEVHQRIKHQSEPAKAAASKA